MTTEPKLFGGPVRAEELNPRGLCVRHGAPLFLILLGGPWLVCRHCLENLCDACEQPASLCTCGGAR